MKNIILLFVLVTFCNNAFAQKVTSYITQAGDTIRSGDTLYFGNGTNPDGSFRWVYYAGIGGEVHFSASYSGLHLQVVKFKKIGNERMGYKTVAMIAPVNTLNFAVDIEEALRSKEVRLTSEKE